LLKTFNLLVLDTVTIHTMKFTTAWNRISSWSTSLWGSATSRSHTNVEGQVLDKYSQRRNQW